MQGISPGDNSKTVRASIGGTNKAVFSYEDDEKSFLQSSGKISVYPVSGNVVTQELLQNLLNQIMLRWWNF